MRNTLTATFSVTDRLRWLEAAIEDQDWAEAAIQFQALKALIG